MDSIYKVKVKNHFECKNLFLDKIKKSIDEERVVTNPAGYILDYGVKRTRLYDKEFDDYILPELQLFASKYLCTPEVLGIWFQQYSTNTGFYWHNHPGSHLAMIYNLELPNSADATKFYGISNLNVEEGDLVIFPAYMPHIGTTIMGNRKTIISCNFDLSVNFKGFKNYVS